VPVPGVAAQALAPAASRAQGMPTITGTRVQSSIRDVTNRLVDGRTKRRMPGSGSALLFANGGWQVSYDQVPAVDRSRAGDPVRICLVFIPPNCPPGDNRGRIYATTNLRTGQSWALPDASHRCGGA
jgi:hypothetical protein